MVTQVAATAPGVVALHSSGTNACTCGIRQLPAVMLEACIPRNDLVGKKQQKHLYHIVHTIRFEKHFLNNKFG